MKAHLINNLDFAKKESELSASISLDACPRLSELLYLPNGSAGEFALDYMVKGYVDGFSKAYLDLHVQAKLPLQCQRCMDGMLLPLELNYRYEISENEPAEEDDVDEVDWLPVDVAMDLVALIEDEVMTAMPIAPTHVSGCVVIKSESGEKASPFAGLRDLLKK